jgi:hypothetical protein
VCGELLISPESAIRHTQVSGFNEHRKQGPFAYANDQPRAPSEEEIGIPVAEAIGRKHTLRSDLSVEVLEAFARTANGQHLRTNFLPTRFVESTTPDIWVPPETPPRQDKA